MDKIYRHEKSGQIDTLQHWKMEWKFSGVKKSWEDFSKNLVEVMYDEYKRQWVKV